EKGLGEDIKNIASRHSPVADGRCTECHSPHKSKLKTLLLADSPELCRTCHSSLKEKMDKEKMHPPAESNCLTCHKPHFSSEERLLVQPLYQLCGGCHGLEEESFAKAHLNINPAVINCRSCHDPHSSKDPKFFKENIHPPFEARACDECHKVEKP
ncbi:MAG TPA: cytochrome c3 family protein, partial [Thermodesulfobacteriota bacterium]|nr:cytochrome c3 family protein [Thermodesulfobacteriota bacterium]